MAKADLIEMEKLCYDGSTPPKKFIKMFKIQAAFIDWDETAMAKNIPLFLEKRAMDVYEKSPSKTDIDVIFKELDEKCGPTAVFGDSVQSGTNRKCYERSGSLLRE